jgi:hypothetical protein
MTDEKKFAAQRLNSKSGGLYPCGRPQAFCNDVKTFCNGFLSEGQTADSAIVFSNEDFEEKPEVVVIEYPEEMEFASNENNTEFCFSPYGDFSHSLGLQRVTKEAVLEMANAAKELFAKVDSKYGTAIPIYYGHPDDPAFAKKYPDKTVYGKVVSVRPGEEGGIANTKWEPGFESLPRGLKFSARWKVREIAPGIYTPYELISLGLTSRPNIPGVSAANENISDKQTQSKEKTMDILKKMLEKLGYTAEQIEAVISGAEGAPSLDEILAKLEHEKKEEPKEDDPKPGETANEAALQEQFKNERLAHAKTIVSNAINCGKATKGEEANLVTLLANSTDFAGTAKLITDRPVAYKTSGKSDELGQRNSKELTAANEFEDIVAGLMKKDSTLTRSAAWSQARKNNPELYAKISDKE